MTYGPPNNEDPQQQPPQQPGYQQPPQQPQQPGYQQPPQQPYNPPPTAYGAGNKNPMQDINAGFKRFSLGRQLVVGGGLLAVIFALISNSVGGLFIISFLLILAVTIAMALPLFGKKLGDFASVPLTDGQIALFGSGGAIALVLLRLLGWLDILRFFPITFWLMIVAMAAMTYGGWMMYQAKE